MKKKCENCDTRIKSDYSFCPSCGAKLKSPRDYGLLGKSDSDKKEKNSFFGGISDKIMMKMVGSAVKMLEKEFEKDLRKMQNEDAQEYPKLKLMINGKELMAPEDNKKKENKDTKKLPIEFSKENLKKWAELKKEEPKTNLKRIGDKIFYELDIPGVDSIKDVSIINLENSLEIRAVARDQAYQKNIQVNLPLSRYTLLKGKLVLEIIAK